MMIKDRSYDSTWSFAQGHPQLETYKKDFLWVDRISWLMDEKFSFGKGRFRFGLDPLINLVPVLGNVVGFVISFLLVMIMWKNGVSRKVIYKMLINVFLDTTIGAIPVLGNIFDFYFKANTKNIKLLKGHYVLGKNRGKGNDVIAGVIFVILLLLTLFIIIIYYLIRFIIGLF